MSGDGGATITLYQDKFGHYSITVERNGIGERIAGPNITLAREVERWPLTDKAIEAVTRMKADA